MSDENRRDRFELLSGLSLALLAALTAVNDLHGGKFGDDEIMGHNQRAAAYAWYQSKSIKETAVSQELSLLNSLMAAGALAPGVQPSMKTRTELLEAETKRYKAEKREILLGSEAVGAAGQVLQNDNGEKGKIVGAQQWEKKLETLGAAGDGFDRATLWLQLAMVCGAISLILRQERLKWGFYTAMAAMGVIGSYYTVLAWRLAATVS